jgi:CubicO group peptidase (beta-lactamase class C family)
MAKLGSCLRPTALGLAVLAATLSPTFRLPDQPQRQDGTARHMDQFVSSRVFSGAVLVARTGHVLFQKAYGMANREHSRFESSAKLRQAE